jgi:hypothetical protein
MVVRPLLTSSYTRAVIIKPSRLNDQCDYSIGWCNKIGFLSGSFVCCILSVLLEALSSK